jgi:cytochrome b
LKVWDAFVRIAHWTLVLSVAAAWFTRGGIHEAIGYAALGVIVLRAAWGFAGSRYARFSQFVRGPRATLDYAKAVAAGRAPRYLGHNPLGAWMVVALLVTVALTAASGWLSVTDRYWGVAWVQETHEALADLMLVLVVLHVLGVLQASHRHRESLVAAMVTGRKPAVRAGDVLE